MLPARVPGYQPRLLDELGALGEVAWVGRGSLNRDDGRIALFRPGREVLRTAAAGAATRRPGRRVRVTRRSGPISPGAARASTASSTPRPGGGPDRDVLDALWDLVWAGEVTNDTFAPLRALRWRRPARSTARPRPGRLTALGPPEAAGRWSLVEGVADVAGRPGRPDGAAARPRRWPCSSGTAS